MVKINYLTQGASTKFYDDGVYPYLSLDTNLQAITDGSNILGVSTTAIAGAMAEENKGQ
jgi:hypothetical protein